MLRGPRMVEKDPSKEVETQRPLTSQQSEQKNGDDKVMNSVNEV